MAQGRATVRGWAFAERVLGRRGWGARVVRTDVFGGRTLRLSGTGIRMNFRGRLRLLIRDF